MKRRNIELAFYIFFNSLAQQKGTWPRLWLVVFQHIPISRASPAEIEQPTVITTEESCNHFTIQMPSAGEKIARNFHNFTSLVRQRRERFFIYLEFFNSYNYFILANSVACSCYAVNLIINEWNQVHYHLLKLSLYILLCSI